MASSSSSSLPDPTLPAPPLSDDDVGFTAEQLISRQLELEGAAREAVPFNYLKGGCTNERGYIRQPVFACKTCGGGGVCAGCSVGCHADHDLVELFAKRSFRCDCGTLSLCRGDESKEQALKPCNLRNDGLNYAPQNDDNRYNKNFSGQFCRCERGKTYNAETEEETMLQCLLCEDWLHESCSSLRPSKEGDDINESDRELADGPLVDHDSFDLFICSECTCKSGHELLQYYLGSKGWIICLPSGQEKGVSGLLVEAIGQDWSQSWKVYGLQSSQDEANSEPLTELGGSTKRNADDAAKRVAMSKRVKLDMESQIPADAEKEKQIDADILSKLEGVVVCTKPKARLFDRSNSNNARLDVFLTEEFRDQLCKCEECIKSMSAFPFIIEPEETYSPPRTIQEEDEAERGEDANSEGGASQTSSSYDLGLAALSRLPRAQMIESLDQYNKMRDALFTHLRPFAESGRVVDGESLRDFFRKQKEAVQQ